MADDSFDFNISKFLAEQKQLLALERERFATEKIKILEPGNVMRDSPEGPVTVGGEEQVINSSGKVEKNHLNSKLVLEENRQYGTKESTCDVEERGRSPGSDKENRSDIVYRKETVVDVEECPAEKLLFGKSVDSVVTGAKDPRAKKEKGTQSIHDEAVSSPKQQDEMEKWVSDTFYSYFPSFNKIENDKKSMLSRARQADYQEYLKNIPQVTTKHQQYMEKYGDQAAQTQTATEKGTNTGINPPAPATKHYLSPTAQTSSPSQIPTIRKTLASDTGAGSYVRKGSPREKHMQDLVHTDLSAILNTDTVDRRNRMLAEEESRRKLEYQKELIKQIEEKRKEVERLREKEKLEEEMLTSRLEQQLKTMQLEEELEREKMRSEKIRIANEQNHIRRLQLLSKLENDHKVFNPYDDQRKTLSENGKEVYLDPLQQKPEKEKVYRYFSNSAQNEKASSFTPSTLSSELDYDSSSESMGYERYQFCKNCRADIDRSFLPQHQRYHRQHAHQHHLHHPSTKPPRKEANELCVSCHKRIEQLCTNCNRAMKRSSKRTLCTICHQALENSRLQKAAQSELKRQRAKLLRSMELLEDEDLAQPASPESPPPNPYKIIDIQYHESENDHDLAVLNPVIVRNNYKKPYSLNIDKDSLFHPSKKTPDPKVSVNIRNGEVFVDNKLNGTPKPQHHPANLRDEDTDELTTDEMDQRISKYVQHYNTLWMKRGTRKNNLISQKNANLVNMSTAGPKATSPLGSNNLGPLPTLSPPKVYVSDRPDNLKSEAMKTTEKKWDIPAVQRTMVSPRSPRVLTQLGAIRKQLQLEQLKMDQREDD
ncbi:uncharacterized protein LOC134210116 isoform X2 [Armigeres subalbatus]|uniref:uncharacterized protein LOC134210116 isoform X2 n=1 Tax=Armigeres subalbatus TaxID=124917 RepID=UPI002ED43AA6